METGTIKTPVYGFPEEYFTERLKTIGLTGHGLVIDAACGEGDWLPYLASLNNKAIGFDIFQPSILKAKEYLKNIPCNNILLSCADMLYPPVKDNIADAVFCFDSMNYTNPLLTFNKIKPVLKKGGIAYFSVNGFGWALNCIFTRGVAGKDISKINMGFKIIINTILRRIINRHAKVNNSFYTTSDLVKNAKLAGFEVIHAGKEATYKNAGYSNYQPCFDKSYLGFPTSYEIILRKQ